MLFITIFFIPFDSLLKIDCWHKQHIVAYYNQINISQFSQKESIKNEIGTKSRVKNK